MNPFENTPYVDFSDLLDPDFDVKKLTDEEIAELFAQLDGAIKEVGAAPLDFAIDGLTVPELLAASQLASEKRSELESEQTRRADAAKHAADFEALSKSDEEEKDEEVKDGGDPPADPDPDPDPEASTKTPVTAGALPTPTALRQIEDEPARAGGRPVALVAAGGARDVNPGTPYASELELAEAMIKRHRTFGDSGPEVHESFAIAKADWRDHYPSDRTLTKDEETNWDLVKPILDQSAIRRQLDARIHDQDKGLVASGGLCAPVTPYYNLMYISVPTRPVMASLPSFSADRGGLRYARPAALSAITTGVGTVTAANDGLGGTYATKTCQTIACPAFQETDVAIFYHCLRFGNLGARTFPELVAQWNNLVLAAHARLAESALLTAIDGFSTQVTASNAMGLGASAQLFNQILVAGDAIRSRNRMAKDAVLRVILPWWAVDLIISDVIRSQFQRFDTDQAKVTALLRSFNIEPTFHLDGANGKAQVFGTQSAGALLTFPATVTWYIFPEGSFLYLDGGTLELGIVRDSVLNATNDFQIFGESFENVAYVGVESLAVTSTVCDTGTVSLPHAVTSCAY